MSRVGRKPIAVPAGVKVSVAETKLEVQGPKGQARDPGARRHQLLPRRAPSSPARARTTSVSSERFHGLARALAANAVKGVTEGFSQGSRHRRRRLQGRRSEGSKVVFALGYSHPVEYPIPEGIKIAVEKQTRVTVSGIDRQQVGQVAAEIRALRKPDPVQAEGDPLRGRDPEEEGWQGRGDREQVERGERRERLRPHGNARERSTMRIRTKEDIRKRIHDRIRKKLSGTPERPRLAVFRSQCHIYAQVIDDEAGRTLCAASTLDEELTAKAVKGGIRGRRARRSGCSWPVAPRRRASPPSSSTAAASSITAV